MASCATQPPGTTRRSHQPLPAKEAYGFCQGGEHAVGKPTHQAAVGRPILVVGEAPAADGWSVTGRPFYRRTAAGALVLSATGVNLNDCLAVLGTAIEDVGFVEAVRCRPETPGPWHPGEPERRQCRRFLERHLVATEPRLVLPLGLTATASCMEMAFALRPSTMEAVVGKPSEWPAPWGSCWILPLYHPSPANGVRWRHNKLYLQRFLEASTNSVLRLVGVLGPTRADDLGADG